MLLGLIRPTAGSAQLFGRDPLVDGREGARRRRRLRRGPALLPVPLGSAQPPAARRLRRAGLARRGSRRCSSSSSCATARRTASAATRTGCASGSGSPPRCCGSPKLLLLDEPTTGLDPAGMRDMRDLVRRLAGEGITILLSSHLLYEVEELCNRVAIIRKGRIVYQGALRDLLATAASGYRLRAVEPERARAGAARPARHRRRRARATASCASPADEDAVAALTRRARPGADRVHRARARDARASRSCSSA